MSHPRTYQRFNKFERIQHIILFTSIFFLILTGFPLRYYDVPFWRFVYSIFGGIEVARVLHRIFGTIFVIDFMVHVVYVVRKVVRARIDRKLSEEFDDAFTIIPKWKDFKDLFHNLLYLLHLRKEPPKFGRFNYKEKFDYWAVWWGTIIMAFTGFVMLHPTAAANIFPAQIIPIASIAHSYEALLDVLVVLIWHFYNVHYHPKYFPLNKSWMNGLISDEEMREEHPLEYETIKNK